MTFAKHIENQPKYIPALFEITCVDYYFNSQINLSTKCARLILGMLCKLNLESDDTMHED